MNKVKYVHSCCVCKTRKVRTKTHRCKVCRAKGLYPEKEKPSLEEIKREQNKGQLKKIDKHIDYLRSRNTKHPDTMLKTLAYWIDKRQKLIL